MLKAIRSELNVQLCGYFAWIGWLEIGVLLFGFKHGKNHGGLILYKERGGFFFVHLISVVWYVHVLTILFIFSAGSGPLF